MENRAETLAFLRQLPKVELHAHLNGCVRESTLFELAKERGLQLSEEYFSHQVQQESSSEDDLHMYNVMPRSLNDCFGIFQEIPKCVNDLPSLRRVTLEALNDFAADNVVYLELRSTPKVLLKNCQDPTVSSSKQEYVETILDVMKVFEPRMTCRFLVSVDRTQSLEAAYQNVQLAIETRRSNSRLVGVELGGNPTKNDFIMFQPAFEMARKACLSVSLHCAEVSCGADSSSDSMSEQRARREAQTMIDFHPDRLGHALLLTREQHEEVIRKGIPIETCPTSNVMTLELANRFHGKLVHGLRQHPALAQWIKASHPIVICTDDPGVFHTTLSKELLLVHEAMDVPLQHLVAMERNAMKYAFCDEETKEKVGEVWT